MPPVRFAGASLMLAALAVLAAGCGTPSPATGHGTRHGQQVVTAPTRSRGPLGFVERDSANGRTVRISPGDRITLILGSSYWTVRGSSAPAVLRQDGPAVLLPATRRCLPGMGCRSLSASFTALAPGTAVITAHRTTCGEAMRCVGSHGTFRLTVIVGSAGQ